MNTQPEPKYDTEWERRWPNAVTPQPEALRLAELMEQPDDSLRWADGGRLIPQAAVELRRLHEVNQELLEALKELVWVATHAKPGSTCLMKANAAIAKSTGGAA